MSAVSTGSHSISSPKNVIFIGGSSGMGKAAAWETLRNGGKVLLVSRSEDKLRAAKSHLLHKLGGGGGSNIDGECIGAAADNVNNDESSSPVEIGTLDATDEAAVQAFAASLKSNLWDGLVITSADKAVHGPMAKLPTSDSRYMMETKFWSAYNCAKYIAPKLRDGGAVVFVSGVLNQRPGVNCVPLAIANGALEGLTRSLALEWGPRLRVNCLSPGFCDTERFDSMDPQRKQKMLENTASSLPLQRVGQPEDMGQALHYLVSASFVTGVVLDVDGGHLIRQYANPLNDPMRAT